jgi:hypothetical protein
MSARGIVASAAVWGAVVAAVPLGSQAGACNRDCLTGIAEQYLTALAAKDPKRAPLAPAVKFTDNGQELAIGDGFWNSASGRGTYVFHVADQTLGSIVSLTTMREADKQVPVLMAVRLRIDGSRRITEVEQIVARGENMGNSVKNLETMGTPRAAFLRPTPPADRVPRAELVRVANMYFSGMQLNDGKGTYPFADDCDRIENGGKATNAPGRGGGAPRPDPKTATGYSGMWTCREQFESGLLHFVSRIRDRRYVAVDEERGLVAAFVFFDHDAGASRHFQTPDGRKVTAGPTEPWTWHIAEVFKVEKGLLHEIEAILTRAPYGMGSGWSDRKSAMSDRIQFER